LSIGRRIETVKTLNPTRHQEMENRILDAALRLFAEKGYGESSMMDIANVMHLTKPSLYHYFLGKEQILKAVFDRHAGGKDGLVEYAWKAPDLCTSLERLSESFFILMGLKESRNILFILLSEGPRRNNAGDLFHKISRKYVEDYLEGAKRHGLIRQGEEDEFQAALYAFMGALVHYSFDKVFHGSPVVKLDEREYGLFLARLVSIGWKKTRSSVSTHEN
jgi:AcrR family transcriptional regulator